MDLLEIDKNDTVHLPRNQTLQHSCVAPRSTPIQKVLGMTRNDTNDILSLLH